MEAARLREHPFAAGLSDAQLLSLAGCSREARFPAGAFVFREGQAADTLYLIGRGAVALEQHVPARGVVQVESLGPGDILGLSWLAPPQLWTLDARCLDPVETLAVDAACLLELLRRDAGLGAELWPQLVSALYHRLVRVRLQRLDVYQAGGAA